MEAFYDIGGIHNPADVLIILKITAEPGPVLSPGFDHFRIFGAPVRFQLIKVPFRQVNSRHIRDTYYKSK